MRKSFSRFYSN